MEKTKIEDEKILILGGLGFIGSNLAQKLVTLGAEVTIYDACLDPYGWNFANIKEIKDNKDFIFNCAAQVGHIISMKDPFLVSKVLMLFSKEGITLIKGEIKRHD